MSYHGLSYHGLSCSTIWAYRLYDAPHLPDVAALLVRTGTRQQPCLGPAA